MLFSEHNCINCRVGSKRRVAHHLTAFPSSNSQRGFPKIWVAVGFNLRHNLRGDDFRKRNYLLDCRDKDDFGPFRASLSQKERGSIPLVRSLPGLTPWAMLMPRRWRSKVATQTGEWFHRRNLQIQLNSPRSSAFCSNPCVFPQPVQIPAFFLNVFNALIELSGIRPCWSGGTSSRKLTFRSRICWNCSKSSASGRGVSPST